MVEKEFEIFMDVRKVGELAEEALARGRLPKDTRTCLTEAENMVIKILNKLNDSKGKTKPRPRGELTPLTRVTPRSESLRVTVPRTVIQAWQLRNGDGIIWQLGAKASKFTITIFPYRCGHEEK